MSITVEEIKAKYPNPVIAPPADEPIDGRYCVGGALCRCLGEPYARFPSVCLIADVLMVANPRLSETRAYDFAFKITLSNDAGDFEGAWSFLDMALTWGRDEGTSTPAADTV